MEEELLRPHSGEEPVSNEPAGSGREIEFGKGGMRPHRAHQRHSVALQLLLTEQARNLGLVDLGPLGTRHNHCRHSVGWERHLESRREHRVDRLAPKFRTVTKHHFFEQFEIVSSVSSLALDNETKGSLELSQGGDGHIATTVGNSVESVLHPGSNPAPAAFLSSPEQLGSSGFRLGSDEQIAHATGESPPLEVESKHSTDTRHQQTSSAGTAQLVDNVGESARVCSNRVLVDDSHQELRVADQNLLLLLVPVQGAAPEVARRPTLANVVESHAASGRVGRTHAHQ